MTLLNRDPNAPPTWLGELPVENRYTYGLAGEKFFRAIKDKGQILGTYCPNCNQTYVPATIFCERCLNQLDEWVDVGITGEVVTFTLLNVNLDGSERQDPEIIALIRFGDGGIVHRLGEVEIDQVEFGMRVSAVFKPPQERTGSILDIAYFKPA
ncbi:MAG: Zn-ribbon domain-containing OB-fold protein [Acidobacteriaceae bacterium]